MVEVSGRKFRLNEAIFRKLEKVYRPYLHPICLKYLRDEQYAEDAISVIFLQLWEKRETLVFENVTHLRRLLFTMVKWKCVEKLRLLAFRKEVLVADLDRFFREDLSLMCTPEEFVGELVDPVEIAVALINEEIEKLKPQMKTLTKEYYFGLQNVKEIQFYYGLAQSTVLNTINNGRINIRKGIVKRVKKEKWTSYETTHEKMLIVFNSIERAY